MIPPIVNIICTLGIVAAILWLVVEAYRRLYFLLSSIVCEDRRLGRILFDIRDGTKRVYEEKRRYPRAKDGIKARLVDRESGHLIEVVNISYGGVLLKTASLLQIGEMLDMNLYLPLFPRPIDVKAKVVRVNASKEKQGLLPAFEVGMEFLHIDFKDYDKLVETVDLLLRSQEGIMAMSRDKAMTEEEKLEYTYRMLRKLFFSHTIRTLVKIIDTKDRLSRDHSYNVMRYSVRIARAMGMSKYDILKIKIAALLHDLGKFTVDKAILNKPGRLNEEEWREVKKHPDVSALVLKETGAVTEEIIDIVRSHHQYYNGSGYPPSGRIGKEIPLGARILAVADWYDAMTSFRPYRERPMTKEDALAELRRSAGLQLDPTVVSAFVSVI